MIWAETSDGKKMSLFPKLLVAGMEDMIVSTAKGSCMLRERKCHCSSLGFSMISDDEKTLRNISCPWFSRRYLTWYQRYVTSFLDRAADRLS
jgi:hypothetical protein